MRGVTDGDTIGVAGYAVRLVGFNAPESRNAQCDREWNLGHQATRRLRELIAGSVLEFERVACACRPVLKAPLSATMAGCAERFGPMVVTLATY